MLEIIAAAIRIALSFGVQYPWGFIQKNITGIAVMPLVWQMLSRLIWKHSGKEREVRYVEYSHCLIPDTSNMKQNPLGASSEKRVSSRGWFRATKLGLLFWIALEKLIKLGKVNTSYNVWYQKYIKESQARKKQYSRKIISMIANLHSTGCLSLYTCSPLSIVHCSSLFPQTTF